MFLRAFVFLLLLVGVARADAPIAKRALIISIDGLRPDIFLRANLPRLTALYKSGSFSFWARTTEVSVTLPSHTSMLTGVVPERHGIDFNNDGPVETVYPKVPTLLQLANRAGYTTAMVAGKSKFKVLGRDVKWARIPARHTEFKDDEVAAAAVDLINTNHPDVMVVHFGGSDGKGHEFGWGSKEQIDELGIIDVGVGRILDALKAKHLLKSTLIIVSSDHGGTGHWHGPNDPRARHIPWIAVGPGIRANYDLTSVRELVINTEDTFATVCAFLNIPVEGPIDGKPILQMLIGPR